MESIIKFIADLHLFHNWGKWRNYTSAMAEWNGSTKVRSYAQPYQERACKTCGLVEHRELKYDIRTQ